MNYTSNKNDELELSEMDIKIAIVDYLTRQGFEGVRMRDVEILADSYYEGTEPYGHTVHYCSGAWVSLKRG